MLIYYCVGTIQFWEKAAGVVAYCSLIISFRDISYDISIKWSDIYILPVCKEEEKEGGSRRQKKYTNKSNHDTK